MQTSPLLLSVCTRLSTVGHSLRVIANEVGLTVSGTRIDANLVWFLLSRQLFAFFLSQACGSFGDLISRIIGKNVEGNRLVESDVLDCGTSRSHVFGNLQVAPFDFRDLRGGLNSVAWRRRRCTVQRRRGGLGMIDRVNTGWSRRMVEKRVDIHVCCRRGADKVHDVDIASRVGSGVDCDCLVN